MSNHASPVRGTHELIHFHLYAVLKLQFTSYVLTHRLQSGKLIRTNELYSGIRGSLQGCHLHAKGECKICAEELGTLAMPTE